MRTRSEITKEFLAKFDALLLEYGAELNVSDKFDGYPECGQDLRATVTIQSQWDDKGNQLVEFCEIELGEYRNPIDR